MKTVFFDIDHTLYDGYLGTDFNLFMVRQKYVGDEIIEKEDALVADYTAGEIDYREAAQRALQIHADCLQGKTVDEVRAIQHEFIKEQDKFFPWVRGVIKYLQNNGFTTYLISAAPMTAIEAVAASLNVAQYYGTELVVQDGCYTGELKMLLNFEEKRRLITSLVEKTGGDMHIGVGDSLGDVDMLGAMDAAILYNPQFEELIALAEKNNWIVANSETIEEIIKTL